MANITFKAGPYTKREDLEAAGFSLVRESRWSFTYKRDRRSIRFTKLLRNEFDWSFFKNTEPTELSGEEISDAAMAISFAKPNPNIPDVWIMFSINFFNQKS